MFLLNGKLDDGMQLWRYMPIQGPAMRKFEATCQVLFLILRQFLIPAGVLWHLWKTHPEGNGGLRNADKGGGRGQNSSGTFQRSLNFYITRQIENVYIMNFQNEAATQGPRRSWRWTCSSPASTPPPTRLPLPSTTWPRTQRSRWGEWWWSSVAKTFLLGSASWGSESQLGTFRDSQEKCLWFPALS